MSARIKVSFTVHWKGSEPAELFYLLDGGIVVPLGGNETIGNGSITVDYLADNTGVHKLEWGLLFPGKTLKQLAARVSLGDGEPQALASSDEEAQRWVASGTAIG